MLGSGYRLDSATAPPYRRVGIECCEIIYPSIAGGSSKASTLRLLCSTLSVFRHPDDLILPRQARTIDSITSVVKPLRKRQYLLPASVRKSTEMRCDALHESAG